MLIFLAALGVLWFPLIAAVIVAVFVRHSAVTAALGYAHRWLHRRIPECPDCAANLRKADEWAEKCRATEADLAAEQANRPIALGTLVADADLAVASDTLLTGQKARLARCADLTFARPKNLERSRAMRLVGPPRKVEAIAPQPAKPRPLPPIMRRQHERSAMIHTGCRHVDGKPAITTAEIEQRAQEMVDAREAQP